MKKMVRIILALTLLLVVAQPTFAACVVCLDTGICGQGLPTAKCKITRDGCTDGAACTSSLAALAGDYRIASVEITHGTDATVQVAEKKTAQPQTARVAGARK
jgi:hypothetical protein